MARCRCRKGFAFSADAALAAVCILALAVSGMAAVSARAQDAGNFEKEVLLSAKAISVADYLVKDGAAMKTQSAYGEVARVGIVDLDAVGALNFSWLAERSGARSVCVEALRRDEGMENCWGGFCARRAIVFSDSWEAGYLAVCVD